MTIRLSVELKKLIEESVVLTGMSQNSWVIAACLDRLQEGNNDDENEPKK